MANFLNGAALPAFTKEDETKFFLQPLFLGGDDALDFDVITDAKSNFSVQKYGTIEKITKVFALGFNPSASAATTQRTLNLTRVKAEGEQGSDEFANKIDAEFLRRGIDRGNIEGTVLAQIILDIFVKGVRRDKNRQLWFSDTGFAGTDYSIYDGIFKKLASLPGGQKLVFPAGVLGTDAADQEFQKMKEAAPNELLENLSDVVIYTTREVEENYRETLKALGTEIAHVLIEDGKSQLTWDGIPVIAKPEWDTHLTADSATIGNTDNHRAVLTVRKNIMVATDFDNFGIETWYERKDMTYDFRADYSIGTEFKNDELTVTSIAA